MLYTRRRINASLVWKGLNHRVSNYFSDATQEQVNVLALQNKMINSVTLSNLYGRNTKFVLFKMMEMYDFKIKIASLPQFQSYF